MKICCVEAMARLTAARCMCMVDHRQNVFKFDLERLACAQPKRWPNRHAFIGPQMNSVAPKLVISIVHA